MKLTVQLVTWNGARWLPGLFACLRAMDYGQWAMDLRLLVLDNGSTDETVEMLKKELLALPFPCELIERKDNIGFAGGHNQLFKKALAASEAPEAILIFNQDMEFEPDCISKLAQFLEVHQEAAVAPRLMRLESRSTIDSLGLKKYRTWRVADIGSGHVCKPTAVFGVSGACAMFRSQALRQVAFPDGAIFDESYGSYKEDVDLAFRMKHKGLRSFVLPNAIAYHARGSGDGKKDQSFRVRYHSYRNHLANIYKNFSREYILDFPFVVCYEIGKFLWYLLRDPKVLRAWADLWRMRKTLYERRQHCFR